jgi:hypothetical protein
MDCGFISILMVTVRLPERLCEGGAAADGLLETGVGIKVEESYAATGA